MSDLEDDISPEDSKALEEPSSTSSLASPLSRRQLAWETAAVLALAVLPAWFSSFSGLLWPAAGANSVLETALFRFVRSLQICLPVCYFIGRSGERWGDFGLSRPRWLLDPSLAIGVWMCDVVIAFWAGWMARRLLSVDQAEALFSHSEYVFAVASTPSEHVLLAVSTAASAFAQELAMRGYLLRRFEQLFHSTWLSVLFTTVLFAGYHTYQGPGGTFYAFMSGLTYAGAFCAFRRLWPLAIAHTFWNWVVIFRG